MIRNAENFLYIENQYFLGSAYAWLSDVETNADHTIPAEIAQKVKRKDQPSISSTFYVRIFRTKASFCCQNFVRKLYFGLNFLAPKFCTKIARVKCWWNRHQGLISPTYLSAAFTCVASKSVRVSQVVGIF